jgi:retron-type reverse transcriptase
MTLSREQLLRLLYIAYYDARRHKGKMSYVQRFEDDLKHNLDELCDELMTRRYHPLPSKCFIVFHPKQREVFAAQFRDRVVHHLYYNMTHQMFERTFIADTYSCIPGRGTHYGVERMRDHMRRETLNWHAPAYVMKLDIRGYFMHINRQRLCDIATSSLQRMATHRVSKHTRETWADRTDMDLVLWLTREIALLDPAPNCERIGGDTDWQGLDPNKSLFTTTSGCGLPIGNLTSQLFSNVYLNEFDQYMKRTLGCKRYGRYVDDVYVVSADREWLHSIIPQAREFLQEHLGLDLHMGKLQITEVNRGAEFLGAFVKPYRTYVANQSLRRMHDSVKQIPLYDNDKAQRSISSFLGVLMHAATYNIRCKMFWRIKFLRVGIFNRNLTHFVSRKNIG